MSQTEAIIRNLIERNPFQSMTDIGKQIGLSRERVRQIIRKREIPYDTMARFHRSDSLIAHEAINNPSATIEELSKLTGFSVYQVSQALKERDIRRRTESQAEKAKKQKAIEAFISKHPSASMSEIAKGLGLSQSGVSLFIRANGIRYVKKTWHGGVQRKGERK